MTTVPDPATNSSAMADDARAAYDRPRTLGETAMLMLLAGTICVLLAIILGDLLRGLWR